MGADRDRFEFQTEPFYLDNDCRRLENTIRKLNSRLVIFDPLTSFLSSRHNMNTAQSVGNLMRELSRTAFSTDSAIIIICHLTKNASGKEIDRHLGSSDIINAARSVLSVTQDNANSDVVTVKHLKSTLAKRARPFYYEIVGNGIIEFMSENDIEGDNNGFTTPVTKKDIAKDMLCEMLSFGAKPQPEIQTEFEKSGVCGWRTVEEAKSELPIKSYRKNKISYWELDG
jgi:RecA-family ATPase